MTVPIRHGWLQVTEESSHSHCRTHIPRGGARGSLGVPEGQKPRPPTSLQPQQWDIMTSRARGNPNVRKWSGTPLTREWLYLAGEKVNFTCLWSVYGAVDGPLPLPWRHMGSESHTGAGHPESTGVWKTKKRKRTQSNLDQTIYCA